MFSSGVKLKNCATTVTRYAVNLRFKIVWPIGPRLHYILSSKLNPPVQPNNYQFKRATVVLFSREAHLKSSADLPLGLCAHHNGPGCQASGWTVRDRIPVGARFSAPVHTGPGAQPPGYRFLPVGRAAGAWPRPPTPILRRGLGKNRVIPLLPLLAFVACSKGGIYLYLYQGTNRWLRIQITTRFDTADTKVRHWQALC
jgi:hypothetical protein